MEGSASVMSTISLVGPEATADAPAPVSPAATTREVLAHTIVSKKRVDSTPTPDLSPVNTEGIAAPSEPDAPRPVTTVTVQEPSPFSTLALPSATHEIFVSSPTPNAPAIAGSETVWTSEQTASADLPPDANSGLPPLLGQPVVETFYTTVTKVGQGITPTPTFPSVKQTETPELPLPNAPSLVTGSSVLQSSFPIGQSSPMPALSSIEQIETPGLPTTPNAPSLVTGNSALQSIFTPENPTRSLSFPFIDQTETLASSSTLNPANLVTGNSVFQSTFTPEEPTPVLTPDLSSTHQFETSALPSDPITPVEVTPTSVIQLAVTREPAGSIPTPSLSSIREAETLISPSYTNGPIVVTRTSLFYSTVTRQGQPTVSMPSVLSTSDAVAPTLGNHFVSTETVVRQQGGYTPVLTSSTA
ncbi:MCM DNA helicase complex subunit, partial [Ascosphaera pollenicola]